MLRIARKLDHRGETLQLPISRPQASSHPCHRKCLSCSVGPTGVQAAAVVHSCHELSSQHVFKVE